MKVTVCEFNKTWSLEKTWDALIKHTKKEKTEFLLLPEMPFFNWVCNKKKFDRNKWNDTVAAHDAWIGRMHELNVPIVAGSRPVTDNEKFYNEGYVWTADRGYKAVHRKVYLPNAEGFWEANWYQPESKEFNVFEYNNLKIGFLICTELWFLQHAREYSKKGVHLLVCPRSTSLGPETPKWLSCGTTASVVSGAYCLSSNFSGVEDRLNFAGMSWIIEPKYGAALKITKKQSPFVSAKIDLKISEDAKLTYPRNVVDEF